ncbi:MAG: DUF5615 family PIN-like protein [Cyanobacteria bacterium P01_E01_bin.42]
MLRYLLDENVEPTYRTQIHRQEPDIMIWIVGDRGTPSRGTKDPEILDWCEEWDFVLVTNNRTSMPVHLAYHISQGHHIPGIFILNPKLNMGENIKELILLALTALENEYRDREAWL